MAAIFSRPRGKSPYIIHERVEAVRVIAVIYYATGNSDCYILCKEKQETDRILKYYTCVSVNILNNMAIFRYAIPILPRMIRHSIGNMIHSSNNEKRDNLL